MANGGLRTTNTRPGMVVDDETAYNPPSSKGNAGNYIGIVLLLDMRVWMAGNREDDHGLCVLPGMRGY